MVKSSIVINNTPQFVCLFAPKPGTTTIFHTTCLAESEPCCPTLAIEGRNLTLLTSTDTHNSDECGMRTPSSDA